MKTQAIALCRVSTPEQKLNNSLTRQEESVQRAASQLGTTIVKTWSGDISSKVGRNVNRRDLLEIQKFCRSNNGVKYLIVDEVDRFMRSIKEMFYWIVVFEQMGVKVWFASDPELNEEHSRASLLLSLDGFKGEGSNEERQKKSISGHEKAIREGRYTFPPKPGYKKSDQPGVHIPHPDEFEPFRTALNEVLSGLYSPSDALRRLNDSTFTRHRAPMKIDKFKMFAQDPYYCGIIEKNTQVKERCEHGQHKPMIAVEDHYRLIELISGTKRTKYERLAHNPDFPLNKTSCHDCDGKIVGYNHSNGKGWSKAEYRCRKCRVHYSRDTIHAALDEVLEPLEVSPEDRSDFLTALNDVWEQRQQDNIRELRGLDEKLKALRQTKKNLTIEMAANPSRRHDIEEALDAVKDDIQTLEAQSAELSNFQQDLVEFVGFALNFTNTLKQQWWRLSHEDRLRCKQLLFPQGFSVGRDEKVYTPQISPLYRLATNKKDPEMSSASLLVELRGIAPRSESLQITLLQT